MKFSIAPEVFKQYPDLQLGVLIIKGMDNATRHAEINVMLKDIEQYCRDTYSPRRKIFSLKGWRARLKGSKKSYAAMEPLLADIAEGSSIPRSNTLVNLYRYVMLREMLPIGGDDMKKVEGNIMLKIAEGNERLSTTAGPQPVTEGELIYTDSKRVLARRHAWRQARQTKITHYTKDAVLYLEVLPTLFVGDVKQVIKNLRELIQTFTGATVRSTVLTKDRSEVSL